MKKEYEHRLEANKRYLEETLEVDSVANLCYERQALAHKDLERVLAEPSRPDRALKFVNILKYKPDNKSYETFLEALCDPSVDQTFIKERLDQTPFPTDLHADLEVERLLEQILKDCFMVKEDSECPVEEVIRIIRVQLRHHRKSLDVSEAEVFDLARTIFPSVKLRKNRRRNVIALQNWCVKPEAQRTADTNGHDDDEVDAAALVPLEDISADRVAAVMRANFFEKHGLDTSLADRLLEEKVDGTSLSLLVTDDIKEIFPELRLGERKKFEKAIKDALEEFQKPVNAATRGSKEKTVKSLSPRKLETYRAFDTRPRPTDVYEKGHILPDEQSRPGHLLEALHKYCIVKPGEMNVLAWEVMQFAAACMNERVNGTIHIGVASKLDPPNKLQAGEIVGFRVDKQQCEVAITDEIYRAFYPDQREAALKCIRDPVYIPVVGKEVSAEDLYVVEVDIIPHSDLVTNEAFFLNPLVGKHAVLLRYVDGAPTEVTGQELQQFMDFRKTRTDLRRENEKTTHAQPQKSPDLHRKLHGLLTGENDYDVTDIFPVLFLSPCDGSMTDEYLLDNFRCIKSLEPLAVFDFDPSTQDSDGQSHGLCTMMESQLGQVFKALTTDNFDKDSEENKASPQGVSKLLESIIGASFRSWIFCNGYEPLGKEELQAATWRSQRAQGFKEAIRFYKEQIPSGKALIIIFLLSRNYDVLLGALEEIFVKFPDQWILLAESERIAQELMSEVVRRCYVVRQVLEERCVIGMPWSHVNQSIMNICGYSSGVGCTIPSSTGAPCIMKEREKNELPDLEILSMTQCSEEARELVQKGCEEDLEKKKRVTEEEFYRGKEVSWWNFFFRDHVLRRAQFNELLERVREPLEGGKNIPEDEKVVVKTLLHQPGAGGTTTAREILWELKGKVRCCVVKQITDQTCDQIAKLRSFEEQDSPKPPLVLIDNEDEEKVFQLCSYINEKARRELRDSRGAQKIFCVLIICVRMTAFPPKKDKHKITLGHELQPEEVQWFKSKYEILEERYKKKQLRVHPKLLISFNILKENFNPDYIKRTVDEFIGKICDPKEKHLLKYIALINSFDFDFQPIPMSCFNVLMCPAPGKRQQRPRLGQKTFSRGNVHWEACLSPSLNVLLNRTSKQCMGGDIKAVRIINNNLSRAILNNLCQRENHTVSDVVLEFLHSSVFKRSNESSVQNQLIKIMKDMLKKRAAYKKGRAKFSPIIMEIGETGGFEQAAEVLKVGFDLFDDPMIAQQIARVYIHCQNYKLADEYARIAQDMKPKNSYLCDTHGQVYKEQLIAAWKECLESEEQLEGQKARDVVDLAFKAIDIFRREQKLSDEDCTTGYNNCGFFSELRVIVTVLDCCRFLKTFKCDKGQMLHNFLVDPTHVPQELVDELEMERVNKLKQLYVDYERPMRRLEDEQIQLKEDSCYQYSPSYSNSIKDRKMFVHLQECLDTYFGEESDEVPKGLREEDACEFRRRRVKRRGGNSLRSVYGLRDDDNAAEEFRGMYKIIEQNVRSKYCNAFDLRTILNLTLARVSLDKSRVRDVTMERILDWTQQLYEKAKKESFTYLEAYLYLVMFHWPTEWRNRQGLHLCSCQKIKEVIREWKTAFQNNHPAQKEAEGKKPDRRKGTTLFFLGRGDGFDEIVFYSELATYSKRQKLGDSIWDTDLARDRLKRLKGTLLHGGAEMSVKICSAKGNVTELEIPTSFPIKDHSLWQKSVQFVLGFCWNGPKAYSVTRDDCVDLRSVPMPLSFTNSRRTFDRMQQKMMSVEAVEEFWQRYFDNQVKLELVEKDIKLCTSKRRVQDLMKKKKDLERDRLMLVMKRTSVLQGPD